MPVPRIPLSYGIELTYACQHACPGCANVLEAHRGQCLIEWKKLFEAVAPNKHGRREAELFRITGGEPTCHPEFCEIIQYVDTFDIPYAVFTNGRWEHAERIISILQRCRNFVGFLVSLHGRTASSHNAFTAGHEADFQEICANIHHAARAGLNVHTNTVLTNENCDAIEDMIAFSQHLEAHHAVFNRYLGAPLPLEPSEEQLRLAIREIEQLQQDGLPCHLGDCVPPCFTPNSSFGPNGGIEHAVISPTGDVRPDNLTGYTFGNIFEQSIEDIWHSEKAQWYRQQIPAECLECAEISRCRGGARAVIVEYGLAKDPLMREPIRTAEPQALNLNPAWKVVPHFTIREEAFGFLLCRVNWSLPVSHAAKPMLDALNEAWNLAEVHAKFGDAGLDLIGQLYREGFLEFSEEDSPRKQASGSS